MSDIITPLPVKVTDGTNTAGCTAANAVKVDLSATAANGTPIKTDGSGVTQPVTGTGAAGTPATGVVSTQGVNGGYPMTVVGPGTAGTPSGGVQSVQGVTNGTSVNVLATEVSSNIICTYGTVASVANTGQGTITYTTSAGPTYFYLKGIIASASGGPCKITVQVNNSTTVCVVFTTAAVPTIQVNFPQPLQCAQSQAVKIIITNNSGDIQDVYGTIIGRQF